MHLTVKATPAVEAMMKRCAKGMEELVTVFYTTSTDSDTDDAKARLITERRVGTLAIVRGGSESDGNMHLLLQGVDLVQLNSYASKTPSADDNYGFVTALPTRKLIKANEVLRAYIDQLKPEIIK